MLNEEFKEKNLSKELKSLLNAVKKAKRKRNFEKIEGLELKIVKLKYANNPRKLQSELKELKKFKLLIKIYMRLNKKY